MSTPALPLLDNNTLVVSPTQLEVIRTCAAMWKWRYLFRRVKSTPNAASHGGKAFDDALNLRYKRHGSHPCTPATEAEMLAIVDKAYEGVELPLEEHRTPARFKEAIVGYNQHYGAEPFEVLGVQVPFAVVLGDVYVDDAFWRVTYKRCPHDFAEKPTAICPSEVGIKCRKCGGHGWKSDFAREPILTYDRPVRVVLRGILDMFIHAAGHNFIVDTKTGKEGDPSRNNYANSAQMKAYCWALPELARLNPTAGLPTQVHGAIINHVIIRPPYKDPSRTPKASDKPRNEFHRSPPEFYSAERLEEWRQDTLFHMKQALEWVATDHFPANERSCTFCVDAAFTNYGTYGKSCGYLGVCTMPANQREMILGSDEFTDYGDGPLGAPGVAEKGAI